jgi:hypothetical protein
VQNRNLGIADVKNEVAGQVRFGLFVAELGNLLQRTPTKGSYQQSLFGESVCLFVCLTCRAGQGRAGRPGEKTWEIFKTWFSRHGFRDLVFKTWDLNFGAWIFTFAVSKTET